MCTCCRVMGNGYRRVTVERIKNGQWEDSENRIKKCVRDCIVERETGNTIMGG